MLVTLSTKGLEHLSKVVAPLGAPPEALYEASRKGGGGKSGGGGWGGKGWAPSKGQFGQTHIWELSHTLLKSRYLLFVNFSGFLPPRTSLNWSQFSSIGTDLQSVSTNINHLS